VRLIENQPTAEGDKPLKDCVIADCGELLPGQGGALVFLFMYAADAISLSAAGMCLAVLQATVSRLTRRIPSRCSPKTARTFPRSPPRLRCVRCNAMLEMARASIVAVSIQRVVCASGQTAAKIREIGNDRFKENKFAEAVAKYDKCLRYLQEEFPSPDEEKQLKEARLPVLLNRAACQVVS
jgi:hypothetical protein